MKRKLLWIAVGVIVLVVAVPSALIKLRQGRLEAEYRDQLRLARAEGIPTTAEEFVATLPKVTDSENAAPLYVRLRDFKSLLRPTDKNLDAELNSSPSANIRTEAAAFVGEAKPCFDLLEEAAKLPHCRFKRDWSQGAAVLFPEYPEIKNAAKLLLIRGSLAASEGRSAAAIADARRVIQMARHLEEEPTSIAWLVARSIRYMALQHLGYWTYAHPRVPAYFQEFQIARKGIPKPNLKVERRDELLAALSTIELCSTPEGRKMIGLREGDASPAENIIPLIQSREVGRIKMVKAYRKYWAALDDPNPKSLGDRAAKAQFELMQGLISFPTAAQVYDKLGAGNDQEAQELDSFEAHRVAYLALLRALASPNPAKPIDLSDLKNPWTCKPIEYKFDGKRIRITLPNNKPNDRPLKLIVPPEAAG